VTRGARQIVVYGWSMGGAIALQMAARSPQRDSITALILDSPVVDWRDVLIHVSRRNHIPPPIARLAFALIERRIDIDFDDLDWLGRRHELDIPMLIVTGDDDRTVPCGRSIELAAARPDLVELLVVNGAGHVGSWNVDPTAYGRAVTTFLDRTLAPVPH
jgi:pimeloyl-ACP methyl ester carboxylesterase